MLIYVVIYLIRLCTCSAIFIQVVSMVDIIMSVKQNDQN